MIQLERLLGNFFHMQAVKEKTRLYIHAASTELSLLVHTSTGKGQGSNNFMQMR